MTILAFVGTQFALTALLLQTHVLLSRNASPGPVWRRGAPNQVGHVETTAASEIMVHRCRRYQQRGKAAEEAANAFYYLTYEGSVDLDAIDDPLQRRVCVHPND